MIRTQQERSLEKKQPLHQDIIPHGFVKKLLL